MTAEQHVQMLQRLLNGTRKRELQWSILGGAGKERFQVVFPNSAITLTKEGASYYIYIISKEGNVVEILRSDLYQSNISQQYKILFDIVRDQSLRISETIDDIFNNLPK